jgi:signal transduction histidine kinase/CheY-like chemotaxis protein
MGITLLRMMVLLRRHKGTLDRARTALVAAEVIARNKAAQWNAIVTGMPDGFMVVDAGLRLVEWNQHLPEFVGVPAELLRVGTDITDILRAQALAGEFGPVDVEHEVSRRVALFKSGANTGTIERRRPNGQILELRRSLLDGGGSVTLYTDITQRRRAEDQLRQAQKMEAIGQLTGGVAHDFNNLLSVILGNLELASSALDASKFRDAQSKLEAALGGAQRAATLTQRLVAFSRRQILEPKPTDVNKIVSGMSELIRHSIGAINLEMVQAAGLWQTIIDPNQLENALLNLAINARDAMPEGGKITIETANAYLDAAYAAAHEEVSPGQYVLVAVSDGGTGMSPAEVEKAFEPFFTTKEAGKGSGLGLSQVFGFVKQSKGHVKIYSELGSGTSVKLYLPRFETGPSLEAKTSGAAVEMPRAQDHETVLVVDDDVDVLTYATEALESLGYTVIATKDAASALMALDQYPTIALLLTDVSLPEMNGSELVEAAQLRHPQLDVLFMSGYPANAIVHRGLVCSDLKAIQKPFTLAELAVSVRNAIDHAGPTPAGTVVQDKQDGAGGHGNQLRHEPK